jgi:beta-xylosidase
LHNFDGPPEKRIIGTGGLWAPTIRHYRGTTYVICTNVRHIYDSDGKPGVKFDNFIVQTDDIYADKWSDPVYFEFWGIDPDLFFDDDRRAYCSGSSWKTDPGTINCFEIIFRPGSGYPQRK